jgi:hypothetical protein
MNGVKKQSDEFIVPGRQERNKRIRRNATKGEEEEEDEEIGALQVSNSSSTIERKNNLSFCAH